MAVYNPDLDPGGRAALRIVDLVADAFSLVRQMDMKWI